MLETIREYSAESLLRSGEAKAVKQRHAEHMLAIAEEANAVILAGSSADEYYTRLDEEQDNLRAAIAWAVKGLDALELEIRLLVAMRWFWVVRGHLLEGRRFFDDAMTRIAGADMSLRATALAFGATFPFRQGENALAKERWEEALVLFGELDDPDGIGRCIGELGAVAIAEGDLDRAAALYESALPLYREQETEGPARSRALESRGDREPAPATRRRGRLFRGGTPPATTRAGRRRRCDLAPQPGTVADRSRSSRRGTRNARGKRDDRPPNRVSGGDGLLLRRHGRARDGGRRS